MAHYHAWLRTGRIFTMSPRRFDERSTGHRWAAKRRANPADRLVLSCEDCPATKPSKRKAPRWGAIARRLAARFDLPAGDVREALAVELAAERGRDVAAGRTGRTRRDGPSGGADALPAERAPAG